MQELLEKSKIKANKSRREELLSRLPIPGPGRKKMTIEEKQKKEIIKKTKEDIVKYLEKQGYGAAQRIIRISKTADNETVKLNANKDVLDRIGVGVEKNSIGVAVQVNINEDKEKFK